MEPAEPAIGRSTPSAGAIAVVSIAALTVGAACVALAWVSRLDAGKLLSGGPYLHEGARVGLLLGGLLVAITGLVVLILGAGSRPASRVLLRSSIALTIIALLWGGALLEAYLQAAHPPTHKASSAHEPYWPSAGASHGNALNSDPGPRAMQPPVKGAPTPDPDGGSIFCAQSCVQGGQSVQFHAQTQVDTQCATSDPTSGDPAMSPRHWRVVRHAAVSLTIACNP